MSSLDAEGPEAHRARYSALRERAARRAAVAYGASEPSPPVAPEDVLHRETIPAGWYWSVRLEVGRRLRVVNCTGRASVSMQIWNAIDPSERFNAGDTVKLQWNALLVRHRLLFSDMGRVLASVTEDGANGRHDMLAGGSTPQSNVRRYGDAAMRNTRDNFRLAALKLGLSRRDLHPCLTLFAGVRTDAQGGFVWTGDGVAGEHVELRAELPLFVTLSNCPHPLDPSTSFDPGAIEAWVVGGRPPIADDPCRTSGEEAERGFDNTRDWLAMRGGSR